MSVSTLTSIAAVRDRTVPTKAHVGKQNVSPDDKTKQASVPNMLVSSVPTELVAPYTAVTAAIVGAIEKVTRANPNPDQYEFWRWLALAMLIFFTVGFVWSGARRKGSTRKVPLLELATSFTAAVGWALSLPNSPLTIHLDQAERIFVPLFVAFAAVGLMAMLATGLRRKAKTKPHTRGAARRRGA
jgi:hypothetical protein